MSLFCPPADVAVIFSVCFFHPFLSFFLFFLFLSKNIYLFSSWQALEFFQNASCPPTLYESAIFSSLISMFFIHSSFISFMFSLMFNTSNSYSSLLLIWYSRQNVSYPFFFYTFLVHKDLYICDVIYGDIIYQFSLHLLWKCGVTFSYWAVKLLITFYKEKGFI